jgi:hypothetical protein
MQETYNGWTNYATWRVNLEFFDDGAPEYYKTAQEMREYVEDYIDQETADGIAKSYAYAFLSDVNWHEIASNHQEEEESEESEES